MRDGEHAIVHQTNDVELFVKLAAKRFRVCLVRVALAAGKFPTTREVRSGWAQGEQKSVVAFDDRCDNGDGLGSGLQSPRV
jgi:hypothetical protein